MAIEGPLGLRVNIWDKKKDQFRSPSQSGFIWPQGTIVRAQCFAGCKLDDQGFLLIRRSCTCGIYTSILKRVVKSYAYDAFSVWFLVEGWGTSWLHQDSRAAGMTSPAVQVIAIVNGSAYDTDKRAVQSENGRFIFSTQNQALHAAMRHFDVPLLTWKQARDLVKAQWIKSGMEWRPQYL